MILLLLLAACTSSSPPAEAPAPPNVLLVTLDTTRADALACYGNTQARTPTLDRLAAEGARFSRAFSVTPLTIPAHSSLFTGLYPPRHGVRDNGDFFLGDDADTLAERAKAAGYATMASVGAEVTSHHWGFSQGFDAYFDDMGAAAGATDNRWRVERPGDAVADDALGWLSATAASGPWMAWVHFFDAHSPYAPPEPHASAFPEHPYLGELAFVDAQLDRLLQAVDLDNTWVIVVADHGEGMGSHGELLHGVLLYNATVRVPLIVRPPGGMEARFHHFPVSLVDVMPTVLSLAGAEAPEGLDGMDLSPWLRPDTEPPAPPEARSVYIESLYAWRHYGWASQRALVTGDQKLIDSTTPELYARTDYAELENRAPADAAAVAALRSQITDMSAAMETPDVAQEMSLDAAQRAQLEALGYMTTAAPSASGDGFGQGLPDPVSRLPVLREVEASRQALQSGALDEALERIDAVLAAEPGLGQPRQMRAHILLRRGDPDTAFAELAALYAERPSAQVAVTMGMIRLEQGDLEGGLARLREAIDREPFLDSAWQPYLRTLAVTGRSEQLDAALSEARAQGAATGTVAVLSAAQAALTDPGAAADLEAAITAYPDEPIGRLVLAGARRAAGDDNAAEELLLDEISLTPWAPQPRHALVELLAEQQRSAEQLEALDALIKLVPPDAVLLHARAQALFNLGRHDDSLAACRTCLALDERAALCKLLEANALKKLGQDEEARAAYVAARALAGLPPE